MNNKGFTLIELLASLVILALITSIATFSIVTIVNNSKKKNYELLVTHIKEAAELYYQECRFSNNSGITCNEVSSKTYQTTIGDLVKFGYLKGNGKDNQNNLMIVNPNDSTNISNCSIKVSYLSNKVKVTDNTNSGSCPKQTDYDK